MVDLMRIASFQSAAQCLYEAMSFGLERRAPAFLSRLRCRVLTDHLACHALQPIESFWLMRRFNPC